MRVNSLIRSLLAEHIKRTHSEANVLFISGYTENAILHQGVLEAGTTFSRSPSPCQIGSQGQRRIGISMKRAHRFHGPSLFSWLAPQTLRGEMPRPPLPASRPFWASFDMSNNAILCIGQEEAEVLLYRIE